MTPNAPVYWYDEIDSTSEEARRRISKAEIGPLWIAARQQSAGRGRLGRNWISPPGNLFTTALFHEPQGLAYASRIPFAAGLAVLDASRSILPNADFRLKWPNDVRVDGAKLCGILVECGQKDGAVWIAVGMGLNIRYAPEGTGQDATSLLALGANAALQPEHALDALRASFSQRVEQARSDFSGLLSHWMQHAEGVGKIMSAGPVDARIEGVFEGLADDGGLILRLPDGQTRIIRAGDVELVRRVD